MKSTTRINRHFALLLTIALCFSLFSCGGGDDPVVPDLPDVPDTPTETNEQKAKRIKKDFTLGFYAQDNPQLIRDVIFELTPDSQHFVTTVNAELPLEDLVARFNYSGAVMLDGADFKSGIGRRDYDDSFYLSIEGLSFQFKVERSPLLFTVTIETENKATIQSKEEYINCRVAVDGQGVYQDYEGSARIRGRGNSTWHWYDKKPYRIKLDKKSEVLGLEANKDWVLLANYRDPTHLMNAFTFEMAHYLGLPFTNHSRYVEVTLNGDYIGLYQLTEQIEVGKSRVNVDEKEGYLLSLDLDDGPSLSPGATDNFWSTAYRLPVCVKSPEDQTTEQLQQIADDFYLLEQAIKVYDYDAVNELLDIPSFINYLIIQEITYNVEMAAPRSVYMHKEKGGKYVMGPVWDFDAGFDFDWSSMYTGHTYFASYRPLILGTRPATQAGGRGISKFFTQLFNNSRFKKQYKERWEEVSRGLLSHALAYIDETARKSSDAMARDYERWPIDKRYDREISQLKTWLRYRMNYLDEVVKEY